MITKRDIAISVVFGVCSLFVSIGVLGVRNFFIIFPFFIVPFVVVLILFFIFRPRDIESYYDKR